MLFLSFPGYIVHAFGRPNATGDLWRVPQYGIESIDSLVALYVAGICGLRYGI